MLATPTPRSLERRWSADIGSYPAGLELVTVICVTVGEIATKYAPRRLVALDAERVRGWTVKRYGVSETRPCPPDAVVAAARKAVEDTLPDVHPDAPSHAFSVVHEDSDGCYVVVGWWSRNGLILHTRTWLSGWDDPAAWTPAGGHATACIWETVAIAHERDAWVRHMVAPPEPDPDGYVGSVVSGMF